MAERMDRLRLDVFLAFRCLLDRPFDERVAEPRDLESLNWMTASFCCLREQFAVLTLSLTTACVVGSVKRNGGTCAACGAVRTEEQQPWAQDVHADRER